MSEFSLSPPPAPGKPQYNRVHFSCMSEHHATENALYEALDAEFKFTLDPCPLQTATLDGLIKSWAGERVYCNPPYGRGVDRWLAKASEATLAVYLLPSRTDTRWWHVYAPRAAEIRFLRGRLRFGKASAGAPFPSVLLIF